MLRLFTFTKESDILITDNTVREEILRRSMVNTQARKMAAEMVKQGVAGTTESNTVNPHAATLKKLDEILDKVSGFDNSKISVLCELALALESGNTKNLITLLKTKDKVVKVKTKKY